MDHTDAFDVGANAGALAPADVLEALRDNIRQLDGIETAIDQTEEDLKALKKEKQRLRTNIIPDLMSQIQSDHFTHDGVEVKLDDFVSGGIPKDPEKHANAIAWLLQVGAGELIKTTVTMHFGKSQGNIANDVASRMEAEGHAVTETHGIHQQTLHKFVRDRLKDGEPLDLEALGVFTGKVAKIKRLKNNEEKVRWR